MRGTKAVVLRQEAGRIVTGCGMLHRTTWAGERGSASVPRPRTRLVRKTSAGDPKSESVVTSTRFVEASSLPLAPQTGSLVAKARSVWTKDVAFRSTDAVRRTMNADDRCKDYDDGWDNVVRRSRGCHSSGQKHRPSLGILRRPLHGARRTLQGRRPRLRGTTPLGP